MTDRWITFIHTRFSSGVDVFRMYDVIVSGHDDDGPWVITIDEDTMVLGISRGRLNLMFSC